MGHHVRQLRGRGCSRARGAACYRPRHDDRAGGEVMDQQLRQGVRYVFGPYTLDPIARGLTRGSVPIALSARLFDTLLFLVENHGRVVTRDELLAALWPGRRMEEGNLARAI